MNPLKIGILKKTYKGTFHLDLKMNTLEFKLYSSLKDDFVSMGVDIEYFKKIEEEKAKRKRKRKRDAISKEKRFNEETHYICDKCKSVYKFVNGKNFRKHICRPKKKVKIT